MRLVPDTRTWWQEGLLEPYAHYPSRHAVANDPIHASDQAGSIPSGTQSLQLVRRILRMQGSPVDLACLTDRSQYPHPCSVTSRAHRLLGGIKANHKGWVQMQ